MPMACNYFMWRSLLPPLAKPITSKSPHIPELLLNQAPSSDGIADTDTNKRHIFTSAFYLILILHPVHPVSNCCRGPH